MKMTVELFDSIINTSQDCVFWKDKERRFLGVNQAFLDYYGFESAEVLIGKTDEDMGWHSDPEPFMQDELRVLAGRSTYKVQGKCMIRGEERDIIASKRPLYEDDRIVGLVGSFVDVTDVIRRNGEGEARFAYSMEKLRKFRYFDRIIDEISLEEILDPLTGVLSRAYSMKFVQALISQRVPFSYTMLDLDNFKFINDSFGHGAGDQVLETVAGKLAEVTEGFGLVGRFGGDELLLIDLKHIEIGEKEAFFEELYTAGQAVRFEMELPGGSVLITGTAGCATFPADADNFNDLFGQADKMLYLGKSRGRNCYHIYEEDKHKDIEISELARNGVFTDMQRLRLDTEKTEGTEKKLKAVMPYLAEILKTHDLLYVREDGRMKSVMDPSYDGDASDLSRLMEEDVYAEASMEPVKEHSPLFYGALKDKGLDSVLVIRIRKKDKISGYLVCAVERSHRIWQENEIAVLYYLTGLLV